MAHPKLSSIEGNSISTQDMITLDVIIKYSRTMVWYKQISFKELFARPTTV